MWEGWELVSERKQELAKEDNLLLLLFTYANPPNLIPIGASLFLV